MNDEREREYFEARNRSCTWKLLLAATIVSTLIGSSVAILLLVDSSDGVLADARLLQEHAPYEALQLLEKAVADAGGTYPDAQVMKCKILASLQGWRAAERYFDTIETPEACEQETLVDLAIAANQGQATWLAKKALLAANHPGSEKEQVIRLLISVQYDLGEMGAVQKHCEELAKLAPQDPEPWLVSAGIFHEMEQFSPALAAYQEVLERSPSESESLRVHFQIAEVSLHLGDLETAEHHIDFLRNVDATEPLVNLVYAKLLRRKGLVSQARDVVEEILGKEPHPPDALMLRGLLNFDGGDFDAAAADFRAFVKKSPYNNNGHYKLGQALQRLGVTEESDRHFERSRQLTKATSQVLSLSRQLDQNPNSRELRLKLAEQHVLLGNAQSAEHWRRTAEAIQ